MNNLKNWIKNFRKNKKIMHRILVGGIVVLCLAGMAAAGYLMENVPGVFGAAQTDTAGKVADDQDGETAELDCSITDLACRLGVSRASLYRALDGLEAAGSIARKGRRVRIVDQTALQEL